MGTLTGTRLAWAGVGRMGTPLCRRLLAAGVTLAIADPDAAAVDALVAHGATAASLPDLPSRADTILSMLPNDVALIAVAAAIAPTLRAGQTFADLSTVSPGASARVADIIAPTGAAYLRLPVSGSTATAASGALTIFASGPDDALDRVAPILAVLGKEILRVGDAEEARVTKLLVNLVVAVTPVLIGEALAFGDRHGLSRDTALDALSRSVVASPLLAYKLATLRDRDWTPAADMDLLAKDMDLALAAGLRAGAPMPLAAFARGIAAAFQANGEGGLDFFRASTWHEVSPR